jgi:hypothetical protein
MAHFAELDVNNVVLQVIVVGNDMILDNQGQESEQVGIDFCKSLFGADTRWVQTSYNGNIRKNYAGIGYTYEQARDAFIAPQPNGDGWLLDETTFQWRNAALEVAQASINTGVTRV